MSLLKSRLGELGISAKSPSEFIEKAKGIVGAHHELQRNKATIENEVRQLELEQEKIIQTKEKEMMESLKPSSCLQKLPKGTDQYRFLISSSVINKCYVNV